MLTLRAGPEDRGLRADVFVSRCGEMTRSAAARLLDEGHVSLLERVIAKNYRLRGDETLTVAVPETRDGEARAENIPLSILYEDGDLLVVDKPKGMVVHPAPGHWEGTLVSALLYHCGDSLSGIGGVHRPGIVHRLDKDTSGLMLVAKNDFTHGKLSRALARREIRREYEALARGHFACKTFTVDAPIGRHPVKRKQMAVVPHGRAAVTHFTVLEELPGYSRLHCRLETGRTHQIRVHLSYKGHPVAGDPLYGGGDAQYKSGQCLHAVRLSFAHPRTQLPMVFQSPAPQWAQIPCKISVYP